MTSETRNRVKLLAAVFFWGASFVATKAALAEIHPVTLITLRFGMGILILLVAVRRMHNLRWVGWRDFGLLASLGAISIAIHQGLQSNGLLFTSATSMSWLVALTPVFTAILARIFLSELFNSVKILGIAIAFFGAILVVTKGALSEETIHLPSTIGDGLALASSFNWAIFSIASKPILKRIPPTLMMAHVMFLGWLFVIPFFVASHSWLELPRMTVTGWTAVVFLGILCSGLAYIFWYEALAAIDASQAASFIYLEPLITVLIAALLINEPTTFPAIAGGLVILLGVYLVNRSGPQKEIEVAVAGD
jgi:drug/metabolite transporter (DMT)-like permease